LPVFAVVDLQSQRVVVRLQQLGHLADQLVLHALDREAVALHVELRQHVLEQRGEVHRRIAAQRAALPGSLAGFAQHRQAFDLVSAQTAVQHRRDGGQHVAHRIAHAADVGLRHRVAIGRQPTGEFALRERLAGFLFVELARLLDAQRTLDEGEAAAQLVLGQVAGQRHDLPALRPRPEQTRHTEEPFVLRLGPQFAQDRQPRVAAVPDDEVRFARPARDGG